MTHRIYIVLTSHKKTVQIAYLERLSKPVFPKLGSAGPWGPARIWQRSARNYCFFV